MKNILSICIIIVSIVACAKLKANNAKFIQEENININPGSVRWIYFEVNENEKEGELKCGEDPLKSQLIKNGNKNIIFAFLIETYFSAMKEYNCSWNSKAGVKVVKKVQPTLFKFPEEKLSVQPRKLVLKPKDLQRVQREQVELNLLYGQSNHSIYFHKPFNAPLDSHITSIYGVKRLYNGHHNGQHLGTDFRAAIGVPIPVANRGKVMLAKDLFYTGYTVIVDHGLDIFTVYAHLSKTLVNVGDIIDQNTIVGLSGNTGRTSGPHLHWGIKIHRQWVDGFSLINESKNYVEFITQ